MNTKEPKAGEYYYITHEFEGEIYDDKIIKLVKIVSNIKIKGIDSDTNCIAYKIVDDPYSWIKFFNNYKYAKTIVIKQWKPNWFYRMTGY